MNRIALTFAGAFAFLALGPTAQAAVPVSTTKSFAVPVVDIAPGATQVEDKSELRRGRGIRGGRRIARGRSFRGRGFRGRGFRGRHFRKRGFRKGFKNGFVYRGGIHHRGFHRRGFHKGLKGRAFKRGF